MQDVMIPSLCPCQPLWPSVPARLAHFQNCGFLKSNRALTRSRAQGSKKGREAGGGWGGSGGTD